MNQLKGIHHVTAITSSAEKNYDFFTHVLGMRLVKKTVNQDDIQTYHLFFADVAVRESGVAELLPSVRVVVFDEAHQLNETGVQFLGQQLTTGQLLDYVRDVLES